MPQPLQVETFCLGDWMTNCYVVYHEHGGSCWIVDAGFDPQPMLDFLGQQALVPRQILLTHAHVDHIAGLQEVHEAFPDTPILIHQSEKPFLTDAALNLSLILAEPVIAPQATGAMEHGQILELDQTTFEVRHTPGHSPGGISLYQEQHNLALVGDTLFAGSIGRYDFPTSDGQLLQQSINQQLLTLPDHTRILPGHGPETTIGHERQTNPFLV